MCDMWCYIMIVSWHLPAGAHFTLLELLCVTTMTHRKWWNAKTLMTLMRYGCYRSIGGGGVVDGGGCWMKMAGLRWILSIPPPSDILHPQIIFLEDPQITHSIFGYHMFPQKTIHNNTIIILIISQPTIYGHNLIT